jgi:oxygen-dependent protoporphyrinogen oxidase
MALDLVLPKKKLTPGERNDESLESFVVRRMGRESLDRLAEPLVGGVNGSDPKDMSLAATYPMLLDMEQQHGSLVRGFLAQRKRIEEMKAKYPPKPGAKPRTFFSSFKQGLQFLTDRMADAAGRDSITTGAKATAISRDADGSWRVTLESGDILTGDAVIVAAEAWAAEPLLRGVDADVADLVGSIPCSSSATILMGFDAADCPFDQQWHGILSPAVEQEPVTGISLMSSKWPDRAPKGRVLLRGFVGGPRDQAIIKRSDADLIEIVRSSFVRLLGVKADAKPVFARVFRWVGGMPQYTMGHLDRVDALEARTAEIAGLALAGGAYRGVGVPNCLESGEKAASKVLGEWGIRLAEDAEMTGGGLPPR